MHKCERLVQGGGDKCLCVCVCVYKPVSESHSSTQTASIVNTQNKDDSFCPSSIFRPSSPSLSSPPAFSSCAKVNSLPITQGENRAKSTSCLLSVIMRGWVCSNPGRLCTLPPVPPHTNLSLPRVPVKTGPWHRRSGAKEKGGRVQTVMFKSFGSTRSREECVCEKGEFARLKQAPRCVV